MNRVFIFIAIFGLLSCSSDRNSKIVHPTEENLPEREEKTIEFDSVTLDEKQIGILSNFESFNQIASIGKKYGSEKEMFGFIEDVATDSFNRIYILDSNKQNIRVYTSEGKFISTLGRSGKGPGEFERARSLANYDNRFLLVNNGYRIEIYSIENEKISFLRTVQLDIWSHSICVLDDKLFIHNTKLFDLDSSDMKESEDQDMIHMYSLPSVELRSSFGQPYASSAPMVVNRLSHGKLSCNDSTSTVLFAFEKFPLFHGYDGESGKLKWKKHIDGLNFSEIIQTSKGGRTVLTYQRAKNNTTDNLASVWSARGDYEIAQIQRREFPEEGYGSKSSVLTYLINSSNGKIENIGTDISVIIKKEDNFLLTLEDNFTKLDVLSK